MRKEFHLSRQEYIHLIDISTDKDEKEDAKEDLKEDVKEEKEMPSQSLPRKNLDLLMLVEDIETNDQFERCMAENINTLGNYVKYLAGYYIYSSNKRVDIDTVDTLSLFLERLDPHNIHSFSAPVDLTRNRSAFLARLDELIGKYADKFGLLKKDLSLVVRGAR